MRKVVVIGFMGSGKTTVGKAVAEALGWQFCDLDEAIVTRSQQSISALFAQDEATFRAIEHEVMVDLLAIKTSEMVIATGGGTPCYADMMTILLEQSTVIYLDCDETTLAQRLKTATVERPMLQQGDWHELLNKRAAIYRCAHHVVNNNDTVADAVNKITAIINNKK
ncbi:MAG: shikimate kinase [Bacteroidales bacterium]|nr:shikimate kinase [Bacteroidales bacterium]